ncbi:MAG TPA: hypothetical protein VMR54_05545 [Thermoanaerobaculia bacterium]|nr:hypothetical protein [Thermoanaerobaculia bacterium]
MVRRPVRPAGLVLALAFWIGAGVACGKKGDPAPPLPRGPRAVSDLAIDQEGGEAVLTFSYPDRLLTGAPLTDLQAIEVYRVLGASPSIGTSRPKAPSGPRTDEAPAAGARRAAQQARLSEDAFYAEARLVASLPATSLGEHARGATVVYRDYLMSLLAKGNVPLLAYAVVSVRREGEKSPLSNIATLTPDVPPDASVIGQVIPEEGRICLEWTAPEKDLLGRPVDVGGYFVYRRALPQEEYERPLNPVPMPGTSYIDTAVGYGMSYFYTVRATLPAKPRIEGPAAEEVGIRYVDVYPPSAPGRLDALSEANLVRLVWDPVPAPDVAGYLVFRAEADAEPVRVTEKPVSDTFFTDTKVPSGKRYRYTVRAVDTAGNVGPPSPVAFAEPF